MRHLLDIADLSVSELDELIAVAEDIAAHGARYADAMRGKKLATLFFEPSTRTRLSFEAAMLELGGSVLGFSEASSSSAAKGECVRDTVRVVGNYADIIAMRHPVEGAAFVAATQSPVPIVNAGDGGHCHPTQTLADLLTIHRELGRLNDLTIGLCGDLLYGRTVHSLIHAMVRYRGTRFVLISPPELRLPDYAENALKAAGVPYAVTADLEEAVGDLDVLYMTRVQKERFSSEEAYERVKDCYVLTPEKLSSAKKTMRILHPLPRVNEIAQAVDGDPRAAYFRQTMNGKLMRMALILKLTGEPSLHSPSALPAGEAYAGQCPNPKCITHFERELPMRKTGSDGAPRCLYCETLLK